MHYQKPDMLTKDLLKRRHITLKLKFSFLCRNLTFWNKSIWLIICGRNGVCGCFIRLLLLINSSFHLWHLCAEKEVKFDIGNVKSLKWGNGGKRSIPVKQEDFLCNIFLWFSSAFRWMNSLNRVNQCSVSCC